MNDPSEPSRDHDGDATRASLIARIRMNPDDQAAWAEFVEIYGRRIVRWCLRWGLQEADAEDIAQTVLIRLARVMPEFKYDPSKSYRAWLKTLTHHAWSDFLAARRGAAAGRGADSGVDGQLLESVEARDDLAKQLEEEFDQELLRLAMERARARVEPRTWRAFEMLAVEGRSGAEVARELDMKVATTYVHRGNVQKLIQAELAKLDPEAVGPRS